MSLMGVHSVDLILIVLCITGLVLGFTQGLLRQVIALGTLYVAAVIGMQYFGVVTGWLLAVFRSGVTNRFLNGVAFLLIVFIVATVLNIMAYDVYRSTRLRVFPLLDYFGGSVLGLATMVILISLLLPVITFTLAEPMPYNDQWRVLARDEMQVAQLIPFFASLKPAVLSALSPWLPGGIPALLAQ
ncbi:MAG: CvpA family protein [Chloroflexi bacterium]|nr:CvpA family protein [Chloroflexota bacterium]